ncbi:MAG TPA: hypothetical protein VGJ44_04480 [Kribbellaceae bacterium]
MDLLPAPRENFAATMTGVEKEVWSRHVERLRRLHAEGVLILAPSSAAAPDSPSRRRSGRRRTGSIRAASGVVGRDR